MREPVMNDLFQNDVHEILLELRALRNEVAELRQELKPKKRKKAEPMPSDLAGFDNWWKDYPRKVAKPAAQLAWKRLSRFERETALDVVGDYAKAMGAGEKVYIPHPATYLNQHRFNDAIENLAPEKPKKKLPTDPNELMKFAAENGLPMAKPGETTFEYRLRLETCYE